MISSNWIYFITAHKSERLIYFDSTSSKLSAVVISFTCVQRGSNAFFTVSKSSPSALQVSVLTVAVPLSKAVSYTHLDVYKRQALAGIV